MLAWGGGAAWGVLGGGENCHASPYPLHVLTLTESPYVVTASGAGGATMIVAGGELVTP